MSIEDDKIFGIFDFIFDLNGDGELDKTEKILREDFFWGDEESLSKSEIDDYDDDDDEFDDDDDCDDDEFEFNFDDDDDEF